MQTIKKRDGSIVPFDREKIRDAVSGAWLEVYGEEDSTDFQDDSRVWKIVCQVLLALDGKSTDVETVQDAVEVALMHAGEWKVARAYITYRNERAKERVGTKKPDPDALSSYIVASKYARHRPDLLRRELHGEAVDRVEEMHVRRFPLLEGEIRNAFGFVRRRQVLPSMRSMQFGGPAVEANHARGYNCCFTLIDRPRVFAELMYLLLAGCGTGYSVQFRHVEKLPEVAHQTGEVVHHIVGDTIEGWGDAVDALVEHTYAGRWVEFAFHGVRKKGTLLKTSGGRAPGHVPLRKALENARAVMLGAQGRQLIPFECHEMNCFFADAVLSGGIRRSAMNCLFSIDDGVMMSCKSSPDWYSKKPHLARANNSAVLLRSQVQEEQFLRVFRHTKKFGEPGFAFVNDYDHGFNPCYEIGLDPILRHPHGRRETGWAFCNLTSINAAMFHTPSDFITAARAATLIGTLQASYTNFPYLGRVSEEIARRDALIGVSMTGMQDAPAIALDYDLQRQVANLVKMWNETFAAAIGINPAARTCCIKPEGTGTLTLLCEDSPSIGAGIHPHEHDKYIRRVTANEEERVFQAFRAANPGMCEKMPDGNWSITFPIETGPNATLIDDQTAIQFLEQVRMTQQNWVVPGTARESHVPGLRHNVSCTVATRDHEWDEVAAYLWKYRDDFTAVSFLPRDVTKVYAFAPYEAVRTPEQDRRWRELVDIYQAVDYANLREDEDGTSLSGEAACAGGLCLL